MSSLGWLFAGLWLGGALHSIALVALLSPEKRIALPLVVLRIVFWPMVLWDLLSGDEGT